MRTGIYFCTSPLSYSYVPPWGRGLKPMNEEKVSQHFEKLMTEGLGLDLTDPNLQDTPKRVAKMYCREFFKNLDNKPDDLVKVFPNKGIDQIILSDHIPFTSYCSHHLLPFSGVGFFLYIPNKFLLGASKPTRVVNFFSKFPSLQEEVGELVLNYLVKEADPKGAMLIMRAVHGCMSCRGVESGLSAGLTTSITYGGFRENLSTRMEGLALIQLSISLNKF